VKLEDLAAWLVLLQNWPREASILCGQVQASSTASLFTADWVEQRLTGKAPPEMIDFVNSNKKGLERLAHSDGLDIARCFSFFAADSHPTP
jgi:hypothetical protein